MNELETCFHCGAEAVMVREKRLPHPDDPGLLELATGEGDLGPGSGIRLRVAACAAHDDALVEAMLDHFGGVSGWSLGPLPGDTCPDAFHSDPAADAYAVHVPAPAGMFAIGYRCPTCGFQSMSAVPGHDREDPVYVCARATLDLALGAPA